MRSTNAPDNHDTRSAVRMLTALLTAVGLLIGLLAVSGSAAVAVGEPVLAVTKTLPVPGPFLRQQNFVYSIGYKCSSLETSCPNATLVDTLPSNLEFVSATSTSSPSTFTQSGQTLTWTFTQDLGAGAVGLVAGTTGNVDITVRFANTAVDLETAQNCAGITATGAVTPAPACATATATVPRTFSVAGSKVFTAPYTTGTGGTGNAKNGVAGQDPRTTVALTSSVTGDQAASSLTIVDPSDATDPFDKFDLVSFAAVVLPAGVQAVVTVSDGITATALPAVTNGQVPNLGGIAPGSVRSVSVKYTPVSPATTLPLNTNFVTSFQVQLRDALRSNAAAPVSGGGITNCATIVATYAGFADVTKPQLCDTYNVVPRTPDANGTKSFTPATGLQMSGQRTTVALAGINASNFPATKMVVEDPTNGSTPFATFDFVSFSPLVLPAGVTADVAIFDGTEWKTGASGVAAGVVPGLGSVPAANVRGVRYTYNGSIAAGATISNSFVLALRDSVRGTTTPVPVGAVNNCQTTRIFTADGTTEENNICAVFSVTSGTRALAADKSFSPASGVIGLSPASTTVLSITGKSAASSTLPLTNMTITDPGAGSGDTFGIFDFVSFGSLVADNGSTWFVDAAVGATWTNGTVAYGNGATPSLPGTVAAANVTGLRYRLASGSLNAGQGLTSPINLRLRTNYRGGSGGIIPGGVTINNIVDVSSTQAPTASEDATYTTVANSYALSRLKSFSSIEGTAGTGATTTATLATTIGGNTPLTTLVVTEPGDPSPTTLPNFFEKFRLTGFGTITVPAGATSTTVAVLYDNMAGYQTLAGGVVPVITADQASHVVGVRITVTGNLAVGSSVIAPLRLQLLNNERTSGAVIGAQTIVNCYDATGTPTATKETPKNNCSPYVVKPQSQGAGGRKTFSVDQGIELSNQRTTATIDAYGTGNVGLQSMIVTDPATGNTFYDKFDFVSFGAFDFPGSATTTTVRTLVEVTTNGTTWIKLDKVSGGTVDLYTDGDTPLLSQALSGVSATAVVGVRFTYTSTTGALPFRSSGVDASNRLRARIVFELSDTLPGGAPNLATKPTATRELNCASVVTTPAITVTNLCDDFQINARSYALTRLKSFTSPSGIAGTGATTTAKLTTTIGGNSALDSVVITEPADPSTPNPFDRFDLVSLGTITVQQSALNSAPVSGLTIAVQVDYDNDATGFVSLGGGATPVIPNGLAEHVIAIRVTVNGALVNPNQINIDAALKLRDSTRFAPSVAITSGTIVNCYDAVGTPVASKENPANNCASYVVTPRSYSIDRTKQLSVTSGVSGLAPSTTATLTVTNTSNVGLGQIVVVENDAANDPNSFFSAFRFAGFQPFSLPSNVRAVVELSTNGTTYASSLAAVLDGGTPALGGIAPADVQRIRITYTATSGTIAPGATLSAKVDFTLANVLRGTTTVVPAGALKNCYATSFSPAGATTGDPCATFTVLASTPGASDLKTWSPTSANRDAQPRPASTITIGGRNSGVVPATSLVLQDPAVVVAGNALSNNAFDLLDFTGFGALTMPQGADRVQADVLTADGVWHNGTPTATLPAASALPGGTLASAVVGVRLTFTNAGGAGLPPVASNQNATAQLQVSLRTHPRSNPTGAIPLGVITNTSNAKVTTAFGPATSPGAQATYTVNAGQLTVNPDKLLGTGASSNVNPNDTVVFVLRLQNTGTRNMVQPVVIDKFGTNLTYDAVAPYPAGGYVLDKNGIADADLHLGTPTVDTSVSGQVKFTFGPNDYLAPGQTVFLKVALTVKAALPSGTQITNQYGISVVTNSLEVNGTTFECSPANTGSTTFVGTQKFCVDSLTITVKQARGLSSLKEVLGQAGTTPTNIVNSANPCPNAGGYTYYPCVANTVVGGNIAYRLSVNNIGNVAMERALVIDYLPRVGDIGVDGTGARLSAWTPTLNSLVTISGTLPVGAGTTTTIYYSTTVNPCTSSLQNGAWTCGGGDDWSSTAPADLTKVTAVGVDAVYGTATPLAPGSGFKLAWNMLAPTTAPTDGSIAWNSFAYTGKAVDQTNFLLQAEPRKVGIRLTNPSVKVLKTSLPASVNQDFTFTLTAVGQTAAVPGTATRIANPTVGGGASTPWTNLAPNGTYRLTETGNARFEQGAFVCTDTANNGAAITTTAVAGGVEFVAPSGAIVTCAITNSVKPIVVVRKASVGGNGTFQFALTPTTGTATTKSIDTAPSGSGTTQWNDLAVGGSYTLTETAATAWESTLIGCTDAAGTAFGTRNGNAAVLTGLPAGGVITCSFTNSLKPVVKVVKTTVGATGNASFPFTLTGTGGSTKTVVATDATPGTAQWVELKVGGSYTISEAADAAWESAFVGCRNVAVNPATTVTTTGSGLARTFTAAAGQVIECAYTNERKPEVTVTKTTSGVDTATGFGFTLTGSDGGTKTVTASDATSGSAVWTQLAVNGNYTIAETTDSTFNVVFQGCVNTVVSRTDRIDSVDPITGAISFTAAAGAAIDCSFRNELKPTVVVRKDAVGGSGTFDFTLTGDGLGVGGVVKNVVAAPDAEGSATWLELQVGGTYTMAETAQAGWTSAFVECLDTAAAGQPVVATTVDSGSGAITFVANAGATIECSFVNTRRPSVAVLKSVVGVAGGAQFRFTLDALDGATVAAGQRTMVWDTNSATPSAAWSDGLTPGGRYMLTEVPTTDWIATFDQCSGTSDALPVQNADGSLSVVFTAVAGATIVCSFINVQVASQPPVQPPVTTPPVEPSVPPVTNAPLPITGSDTLNLVLMAGVLVALGFGAMVIRRRRTAGAVN